MKIPFSTGKTVVAASAILFLFYSFVTGAVTSSLDRRSERLQTYRRQTCLWYHKSMPQKLTSIALNFVFCCTDGYISNTCVDIDYEAVKRSLLKSQKMEISSLPPPPPDPPQLLNADLNRDRYSRQLTI